MALSPRVLLGLTAALAASAAGAGLWRGPAERWAAANVRPQCSAEELPESVWEAAAAAEPADVSLLQRTLQLQAGKAEAPLPPLPGASTCIWIALALSLAALGCVAVLCLDDEEAANPLLGSTRAAPGGEAAAAAKAERPEDNDELYLRMGLLIRQPPAAQGAGEKTLPFIGATRQPQTTPSTRDMLNVYGVPASEPVVSAQADRIFGAAAALLVTDTSSSDSAALPGEAAAEDQEIAASPGEAAAEDQELHPICPFVVLPKIECTFLISMDSAQDALRAGEGGFDVLGPSFRRLFRARVRAEPAGRSLGILPPGAEDVLCSLSGPAREGARLQVRGGAGRAYAELLEEPGQAAGGARLFVLSVAGRPHVRLQVQNAANCTLLAASTAGRVLATAAPYAAPPPAKQEPPPSLWRVLARPESDAMLMVLCMLGLSLFKLS